MTVTSGGGETEKLLAEREKPGYSCAIAKSAFRALTLARWRVWFAQPSGSFVRRMRNIITKLLIVVVAGRTAGDG